MRKYLSALALTTFVIFGVQLVAEAQWTWTPQTGRWVNLKHMPKETPELQVEHARSLMLQGKLTEAFRQTEKFNEYYANSDMADQNQFLRGEIRLAQGKPMDAAKEFQQVLTKYPQTKLYDQVIAKQYEIGDSLYERGKTKLQKRWALFRKSPFKRAIEVYSMVIENQPFTAAAAEAQYKVGLCHFTRKEYTEAAFEYRRVIEDYSTSQWVDDASYGLAECYYEASLPPEYDQAPSLLAIEAIDNFSSRFPSDTRVSELGPQRIKMRENVAKQRLQTAQHYERRREFEAARISYEVVVEQYSETTSGEKARAWLAEHPAGQKEMGA